MKKIQKEKVDLTPFWSQDSLKIKTLVLTSVMLGLYATLSYISNTFFKLPPPFPNFLSVNVGLVFLMLLVFVVPVGNWMFAAIVGGFLNFIWAGAGSWVGALFNVLLNFFTLLLFFGVKKLLLAETVMEKTTNRKFVVFRLMAGLLLTSLGMILINIVLNGLIFTPLYFWIFGLNKTASFVDLMTEYQNNPNLHAFFFFIPDYWLAMFGLYGAFNAIQFTILMFLLFPLLMLLLKNQKLQQWYFA